MDAIEIIKTECIRRLRENQDKINKVLTHLPEEEIWWRPNPASNSIGNLILHLCGNLTQYVLSSIGGQSDHRERSKEFEAIGPVPASALLPKFNGVMEAVYSTISTASETEWMRIRAVQCYQESGIGILIHVTEHLSYHTGQIIYLIKWKGGKVLDFYSSSDLEQRQNP
ncbi:MAG: DinB family protein [Saprospiraceae bacterium]|nr:DinB family protein [Saprospiraceae bacterium]